MYVMLGSLESYRLHTRKLEDEKILVPKTDVIKEFLLQQAVQAVVATMLYVVTRSDNSAQPQPASLIVLARQFFVAIMVLDTWLVVPYTFGALYNHPLESLILDTVGGALSFLVSRMSHQASIFFFSFATLKTIDDQLWAIAAGKSFPPILQKQIRLITISSSVIRKQVQLFTALFCDTGSGFLVLICLILLRRELPGVWRHGLVKSARKLRQGIATITGVSL